MRHLIGIALCLLTFAGAATTVCAGPGGYSTPASSYGGGVSYAGGSSYSGGSSRGARALFDLLLRTHVFIVRRRPGLPVLVFFHVFCPTSPSYYPAYSSGYPFVQPLNHLCATYGYSYTNASYYNGHAYGWPLPTSAYSYSSKPR